MRNTLETRLGIFVALSVIAAVLILETVGGIERFRRGYRLMAEFNNVQDLKAGNVVKMAGFEVGRVEEIKPDYEKNKVRVAMKLRRDVIVRTDSTAAVKFTGLLGQNYVDVTFGSSSASAALDGAVLAQCWQGLGELPAGTYMHLASAAQAAARALLLADLGSLEDACIRTSEHMLLLRRVARGERAAMLVAMLPRAADMAAAAATLHVYADNLEPVLR